MNYEAEKRRAFLTSSFIPLPFLKCIPEAEKSETRLEAVFQATKAEYNRLRPTFLFYPINA
jgi:hypothetical protein